MKPRSLIIDLASVKTGIVDRILTSVPENIEYLSLHPLFGPEIESFKGENLLAINPRTGPLSRSVLRFLSKVGLRTTHVSADEHDRRTAVTQALHHFAYLSLATCMMKLMRRRDLERFSTRSLRKTIGLIQSFSYNTETILCIQRKNRYAARSRRAFARTVSALSRVETVRNRRFTNALKIVRALKGDTE
jgi:prephenate dehydrogenase